MLLAHLDCAFSVMPVYFLELEVRVMAEAFLGLD